jgi:hypothetical protein
VSALIFVTCRDRVTPLLELLAWAEQAGLTDRLVLVDNASTWEPLLDLYGSLSCRVVRLSENLGQHAPWVAGLVDQLVPSGQPYVVTDPDVVPDDDCPPDVLDHLAELLARHPDRVKAGLGLRTDDLPLVYRWAGEARAWERQFWERELSPGVFDAPIDTTFAMYQAGLDHFEMGPALRTGKPYLARHLSWYIDSAHPTDEELHYRKRARGDVVHWSAQTPPAWLLEAAEERMTRAEKLRRLLRSRRRGRA